MNYKLTPLFLMLFVCAFSVQAKMFKWVDEEGNTHFGDKIPDRFLNKEHKELNAQGAVMREHKEVVAETEEQRQEKRRLKLIKVEEEKKAKEQAKQDRVLLDTYTTEEDLTDALDSRIEAVGSQLQLSRSIIEDSKRKLAITEKNIAAYKTKGEDVPKDISDKAQRQENQLHTYEKLAVSHEKRKQEINEQFVGYIKRFRELKANQQRVKERREARRKEALGL